MEGKGKHLDFVSWEGLLVRAEFKKESSREIQVAVQDIESDNECILNWRLYGG